MYVTNKGRVISLALAAVFAAGSLLALDINKLPPDNWTVPSSRAGIRTTMTDATPPRVFIALAPCRIVDTRGNGAPIQGGAFGVNQIRTWVLTGNCGLPVGADAVSLNLTVTGTGANAFGFATLWPTGSPQPTASNINWSAAGQTIANAVIVPLGGGGNVSVISGNAGTDMVLDINGYFSDVLGTPSNVFRLTNDTGLETAVFNNNSTTCGGICGFFQGVGSGNAIEGDAFASTGATIGVEGFNASTSGEARGVSGQAGGSPTSATSGVPIGVQGASLNGFGVLGRSRAFAVTGKLYDGSGNFIAEGLLGTTFGTAPGPFSGPWGVFANGDFGASGAKHFVEPHPSAANKVITYSSLEGREVGTYFRGTAQMVNRTAVIEIPEDFRIVTADEGITVQVTPIGGFAQVYIESQDLNRIVVRGSKDVQFHYMVNGIRKAFRNFEPVGVGYEFMPQSPDQKMPPYLTEEAKGRLIANGTYNSDGTVNMETAEKAGFTKIWADRAEQAREAAAKATAQKKATTHQ